LRTKENEIIGAKVSFEKLQEVLSLKSLEIQSLTISGSETSSQLEIQTKLVDDLKKQITVNNSELRSIRSELLEKSEALNLAEAQTCSNPDGLDMDLAD
jgi:hypothetical protein